MTGAPSLSAGGDYADHIGIEVAPEDFEPGVSAWQPRA